MDNDRLKKLAGKMVDLFLMNEFRDPQEAYDVFSNIYLSQKDYFSLFKPEDILKLIFYIYSLKNTKDFKVADNLINNLGFCNLLLITTEPYDAICGACNGDGDFDCETCYGTGEATCPECEGERSFEVGDNEWEDCNECGGTGEVTCQDCVQGRVTCQDCDGIGEVESDEVIYKLYQIVTWNNDIKNLCEMNEDSHTPAFSYDYFLKNHKDYIVLIIRDDNDRFIKDLSPDDMYSTYYDDSPELSMGGSKKLQIYNRKLGLWRYTI